MQSATASAVAEEITPNPAIKHTVIRLFRGGCPSARHKRFSIESTAIFPAHFRWKLSTFLLQSLGVQITMQNASINRIKFWSIPQRSRNGSTSWKNRLHENLITAQSGSLKKSHHFVWIAAHEIWRAAATDELTEWVKSIPERYEAYI